MCCPGADIKTIVFHAGKNANLSDRISSERSCNSVGLGFLNWMKLVLDYIVESSAHTSTFSILYVGTDVEKVKETEKGILGAFDYVCNKHNNDDLRLDDGCKQLGIKNESQRRVDAAIRAKAENDE